ncbi:MAG: aldehyde ferredoxin oxidoreductase family protein [Dehalococcoidales bacterium]|nr:aldehyde ferredoxin oxidoreductase family protein [Dehalococcoidales bacterium]
MTLNTGRLLRVDLSSGKVSTETIPESITEDFVGGRGYGISYLYQELAPGIDPLGEKNKLMMLNGPLAGNMAQAVSRWMVCTRSPLTGAFARSVCGADFGAWLKFAGYELIIVEGKAEKPVYVHLTADGCQILDAGEIWGKDTKETQAWLTRQYGSNTRTACIGPAGENLVKYAAIVSDRRTAGRCGTGTVMGSKNLKAIAVTAERKIQLADAEAYDKLAREQVDIIRNNRGFQNHKEWGTTATQDITNAIGVYPVQNFRYGQQTDYEKITGEQYRKLRTGDMGCYSCPARCGKVHTVTSGVYAGAHSEGPEYETIWAFTGPIESNSIEASIAADQLCDDLGLDTISTGGCIGFAYELYEKGLLKKSDTDGLELIYGRHEPMITLVKKIARREGIGDLLAEGTMRAAATIGKGAEAYAMHVKGLELPAYEPRGAKSQGYNYVTANIGANHCYGYAAQDIFGVPEPRPTDRFSEENADVVIYNQDGTAFKETGIVCGFAGGWGWVPDLFGKLLAAARGIERFADNDYLNQVGARIFNLERAFNVREGFYRKQDTLPERMLTEPLHTRKAPGEGQMVSHQDEFLDEYYSLRGWTKEGIPDPEKLKELGLDFALKDMTRTKTK